MSPKNTRTEPAKTMLVIAAGMLVIYLITRQHWALITALAVCLIGAFSAYLSARIDFLWMKLSWVLGMIVPNILLSVVFYLFLTPIALISRIGGKSDPLGLKNNQDSMFKDHSGKQDKSVFEKPW